MTFVPNRHGLQAQVLGLRFWASGSGLQVLGLRFWGSVGSPGSSRFKVLLCPTGPPSADCTVDKPIRHAAFMFGCSCGAGGFLQAGVLDYGYILVPLTHVGFDHGC